MRKSLAERSMRSLWRTITQWLNAVSGLLTVAFIIGALGGTIVLATISNLWAHVTGVWLVVECLGLFELFLCSFIVAEKRDENRRTLEITGAILYAQLDDSDGQSLLVKIRLVPSRPKNIKAFALSLGRGDKLCDGERLPIYGPMFLAKLPDAMHHWRKNVEQEKIEGDIEKKLAHDDAILLSSPCSGWLNFACREITIKSGDTVTIVVTVIDETGYKFTIRDELVQVH
jgi:hypothetical protein